MAEDPEDPQEVDVPDRPEQQLVDLDVAWCHECRGDVAVQVVRLAGDPVEVAVCLDCGTGAETWWQPAPLLVSLAEQGKTFN